MPASTPAIFVAGPTVVTIDLGGESPEELILGYSDNDNLPSISFTDHQHEVKTVLSGNAPEEIVLQGTTARIALALVKWDKEILVQLLAKQRGAENITQVGRRIVGDSAFVILRIKSVGNSGYPRYEFPVSHLVPDSVTDSQWGNRERVLTLNFAAIPQADGTLYTYLATAPTL